MDLSVNKKFLQASYTSRLWLNSIVILLGDAFSFAISILFAGILRELFFGDSMVPNWIWMILPVWSAGCLVSRLIPGWGYNPVEHLRRIEIVLAITFAISSVGLFITQTGAQQSRFTLIVSFLLCIVLIPLFRIRVKTLMLQKGLWGVPTVIYGNDQSSAHVLNALMSEPGMGYVPIGIFDNESPEGSYINGIPVLGPLNQNSPNASYAIIAASLISREELIMLLEGPLTIYRKVVIIPDMLDAPSLWIVPRDFLGLIGLEVTSNLLNPVVLISKRVMDVTLVLISAPFWLPLCGLLALMIWLEDQTSPFFIQERIGHYGEKFSTFKFRTMRPNAEQVLKQALEDNPKLAAEWAEDCKLRDDPRITRVGSLLRKTSLDELPQLINVLRGDMSLVGPRPLPDYHHNLLSPQIKNLRDRVRPGLTGLWQVSGRSESGTKGIELWDAYYVRNWSVWLDLIILFRTIRVVLSGRGAY